MKSIFNKTASLLILTGALGAALAGCNKPAPAPETTGNFIDDTTTTTKVKAALLADDAVKSLQISVTTTQGVVQLSGGVDNADQKSAAAKDAAAVAGVKDVTNNITVNPESARETTGNFVDDTTITAKVKAALLADDAVKSLQISVTTTQGVVQLSGGVDNADQKSAAAKDAAAVAGVKDVANNITVK
jgi:hyperosmotically inducible protein